MYRVDSVDMVILLRYAVTALHRLHSALNITPLGGLGFTSFPSTPSLSKHGHEQQQETILVIISMAAFLQFFLSYGIRRIRCLGRSRLKCSEADEALTLMSQCMIIMQCGQWRVYEVSQCDVGAL